MIRIIGAIVLASFVAVALPGCDKPVASEAQTAETPTPDLLPSEAREQMYAEAVAAFQELPDDAVMEDYEAIQQRVIDAYLPRIIIDWDQLDDEEVVMLCEMASYMVPDLQEPMAQTLTEQAAADGVRGRVALKTQAMFLVAGDEVSDDDLAAAEELCREYRSRFDLSREEDFEGLYPVISNIMWELNDRGDLDEALRVAEEEMVYLRQFLMPHASWQVVLDATRYLIEADRMDEAEAFLMENIAYQRAQAELIEDEELAIRFNNMAMIYEGLWKPYAIIGTEIEPAEFTHVLNSDEGVTFEGLLDSNKVILIDVFTVWCGPCIASFPELIELQATYGEELQIIGMTDFQGMMTNHGAETEEDISEARELELMPQFIAENNLSWPIVFVSNEDQLSKYGVSSYPTVLVIDSDGLVQFYGHPMDGLAEKLEELLGDGEAGE